MLPDYTKLFVYLDSKYCYNPHNAMEGSVQYIYNKRSAVFLTDITYDLINSYGLKSTEAQPIVWDWFLRNKSDYIETLHPATAYKDSKTLTKRLKTMKK